MTISRFSIDRLTITTLALAATLPFMAVSPVKAATIDCAQQAQELRIAAASASPEAAAKLLRTVNVAEKLCAEGGRFEASRKFAQARQQLDGSIQLAKR